MPSSQTKSIARKTQTGTFFFFAGTVALYLYVATGAGMTQGVLFASCKKLTNKTTTRNTPDTLESLS